MKKIVIWIWRVHAAKTDMRPQLRGERGRGKKQQHRHHPATTSSIQTIMQTKTVCRKYFMQIVSCIGLVQLKKNTPYPFKVRWTRNLYPSFSGNGLYVVVCHCFPHCFTSLSLNRLSCSFVTCWVVMAARWRWKISDRREDRTTLVRQVHSQTHYRLSYGAEGLDSSL